MRERAGKLGFHIPKGTEDPVENKKMKKHKGKSFWKKKNCLAKKILIVDAVLIALVGTTYAVNASQYHNKFLSGTYINGVNVGDKTVKEVEETFAPTISRYRLTLTMRGGATETIDAPAIDLKYTPGNEIKKLLDQQNSFAWLKGALGGTENLKAETPVSYDESKLDSVISSWAETQEGNVTAPVNAHIEISDDNEAKIIPEVTGNQLNLDNLKKVIKNALDTMTTSVDLDKTDAYNNPTVLKDDKELTKHLAEVKTFLNNEITFNNPDGTTKALGPDVTKTWLSTEDGTGYLYVDDKTLQQKATEWATQWAADDDNYGPYRTFRSTNYGNIRIATSDMHGHTLDIAQTANTVYQDLKNNAGKVSHEPTYSKYADAKSNTIGGSYVEVDVDAQHVYVYQDHNLVFDTSCVTGKEYKTPTPSGIYSIYMKEQDASLTGAMTADGTPSYVSHVKYWMPFYEGYGLHDASWRDEFGGSIYEYSGSHGCVNLPTSSAAKIWELCPKGTPVVVFRESEQPEKYTEGNSSSSDSGSSSEEESSSESDSEDS